MLDFTCCVIFFNFCFTRDGGVGDAGWRYAYPAYELCLRCRVALRLPGLQIVPMRPGKN